VKSVRNVRLVADAARSVQTYARELGFVASGSANRSIEDASAGDILQEYERRVKNPRLRLATRTRFRSGHYADAVESGVKALNECVRALSGSTEDGDGLMTSVFSEKKPKLRINRLRTDSDKSEQRGHMMMCQGCGLAKPACSQHFSRGLGRECALNVGAHRLLDASDGGRN
jgi:hypothetical protein